MAACRADCAGAAVRQPSPPPRGRGKGEGALPSYPASFASAFISRPLGVANSSRIEK